MFGQSFNILAFSSIASALSLSTSGVQNGCLWTLPDVGSFNTEISHNWSISSTASDIFEDLASSTYTVAANNAPFSRRFDIVNVGISTSDPSVTLTVPGGQGSSALISTAQIVTGFADILYGSVRTVAKISNVAGTTHGFSFYANDTQEVDFAFLTSDISVAHLTNEQTSATSPATSYQVAAPSDAATAWHEYRVDWLPGATNFYIDSVLVKTITENVPSTPAFFLWNNWSNGNSWTAGPPLTDSVLKIQSINAYFNRTSVTDSIIANPSACIANPFTILSAYYADRNVTQAARTAFMSGQNLFINTTDLDDQLGGDPWTSTTKTLTILYTYGTETRVFVAAEGSGSYTIIPGGIASAPGSVDVPTYTPPSTASIDIISVVWGTAQVSTSSLWSTLYSEATNGWNFQLTDTFFGIDPFWGHEKSAVIWYTAKNGSLAAVVGRENAYVKFT